MKKLLRRSLTLAASLTLGLTALWTVALAAPAESAAEAVRALSDSAVPLALLRFERGELLPPTPLSLPAALTLRLSPLLFSAHDTVTAAWSETETDADASVPDAPMAEDSADAEPPAPAAPPAEITVRDNGVSAATLRPSEATGYLTRGRVYVHNASAASLTEADLSGGYLTAADSGAPLVLILHTHGCEAYTMPPGEEYAASDDHRTLEEDKNVLRVGDEIARVLTDAGIGVLHDRTLHDYPSYSGAYNRSLETAERYLREYPSLLYILDVHRDAVEDAAGRQYKLLCEEEPNAAQLEFVVGSDGGGLRHDRWRENLRLACAVQERLLADYPTLLRPIVVRNSRYNQQLSAGSLLLEVGTAGNSLAEALTAARLFAQGFAETVCP